MRALTETHSAHSAQMSRAGNYKAARREPLAVRLPVDERPVPSEHTVATLSDEGRMCGPSAPPLLVAAGAHGDGNRNDLLAQSLSCALVRAENVVHICLPHLLKYPQHGAASLPWCRASVFLSVGCAAARGAAACCACAARTCPTE